jgi:hypothetical protein
LVGAHQGLRIVSDQCHDSLSGICLTVLYLKSLLPSGSPLLDLLVSQRVVAVRLLADVTNGVQHERTSAQFLVFRGLFFDPTSSRSILRYTSLLKASKANQLPRIPTASPPFLASIRSHGREVNPSGTRAKSSLRPGPGLLHLSRRSFVGEPSFQLVASCDSHPDRPQRQPLCRGKHELQKFSCHRRGRRVQ